MTYKGPVGDLDANKLVEQRAREVLDMLGKDEQEIVNAFIKGQVDTVVSLKQRKTSFFDYLGGGLATGAILSGIIVGFGMAVKSCDTDSIRYEIRTTELKSVVSENSRLVEENRHLGDLKEMMIKNCSSFMSEVTRDNEEAIQKTQAEIEEVKKTVQSENVGTMADRLTSPAPAQTE